jgi:hypothetical protein
MSRLAASSEFSIVKAIVVKIFVSIQLVSCIYIRVTIVTKSRPNLPRRCFASGIVSSVLSGRSRPRKRSAKGEGVRWRQPSEGSIRGGVPYVRFTSSRDIAPCLNAQIPVVCDGMAKGSNGPKLVFAPAAKIAAAERRLPDDAGESGHTLLQALEAGGYPRQGHATRAGRGACGNWHAPARSVERQDRRGSCCLVFH